MVKVKEISTVSHSRVILKGYEVKFDDPFGPSSAVASLFHASPKAIIVDGISGRPCIVVDPKRQ